MTAARRARVDPLAERAALLDHELRTPLAMIVGYAELLETRDDERTRDEATKRIREAAERLGSLIEALVAGSAPAMTGDDGSRDPVPAGSPSPYRVSVVGDPAVRRLLRMTLLPELFDLVEAADGKEAVELARANPPDLVVLDWQMPRADVLTEFKTAYPGLPIVVVTVQGRAHVQERSLQPDVVLTKPVTSPELLAAVERLLG